MSLEDWVFLDDEIVRRDELLDILVYRMTVLDRLLSNEGKFQGRIIGFERDQ